MTGHNPPREWQSKAFDILKQHWLDNVSYRALIAACPGAGKTLFAVTVADWLLRNGTVTVALVIVPTVNVQMQWVETFEQFGIHATADANNDALSWRRDANRSMIEDFAAIVITYQQMVRDPGLFVALVRRHKTLLIADEIHHADDDEKFGIALRVISDDVVRSLALSGTPFNTKGGALALCETCDDVDDDGSPVRKTVPTFEYSYGKALDDRVCRAVQFVKVYGEGKATYQSLIDARTFEKIFRTTRETDPIGPLLDPGGEYMVECIRQGLAALARMREAGDRRAAMLVVARDVKHGNRMITAIEDIKKERPEWVQFTNTQEIYNDTLKAHTRIEALAADSTDIVVSVRMISEGVDVKRLRVGIFATDWLTRMFFIQFVGRFIRYEQRPPLDAVQHAVVVVLKHPKLLLWTKEIEEMILASEIRLATEGGSEPPERKSEMIDCETRAGEIDGTYRGEDGEYDADIIAEWGRKYPTLGNLPAHVAMRLIREMQASDQGEAPPAGEPRRAPSTNTRERNNHAASAIVRYMQRINGKSDDELFAQVNGQANAHVGIERMDKMTPEATLKRRLEFLQGWLKRVINEQRPDLFRGAA